MSSPESQSQNSQLLDCSLLIYIILTTNEEECIGGGGAAGVRPQQAPLTDPPLSWGSSLSFIVLPPCPQTTDHKPIYLRISHCGPPNLKYRDYGMLFLDLHSVNTKPAEQHDSVRRTKNGKIKKGPHASLEEVA